MNKNKTLGELLEEFPFLTSFFSDNNIDYTNNSDKTLGETINLIHSSEQEELAIDINVLE